MLQMSEWSFMEFPFWLRLCPAVVANDSMDDVRRMTGRGLSSRNAVGDSQFKTEAVSCSGLGAIDIEHEMAAMSATTRSDAGRSHRQNVPGVA